MEHSAPHADTPEPPAGTDDAFASALQDASLPALPQIGDRIRGRILSVRDDAVIVDCGARSEALLDPRALRGQQPGEVVEALVLQTEPELRITTCLLASEVTADHLQNAFRAAIPVEGKILETTNGGYRVALGPLTGFLPQSKAYLRPPASPEDLVGLTCDFMVLDYQPEAGKLVLSRRELLEQQQAREREALLAKIEPGAVLQGRVSSLHSFGAFVDLGGIEGLVHISEVSSGFIKHPSEALRVGQEVQVKVLKIDVDKDRISLSIKAVQEDQWKRFCDSHREGDAIRGTIQRKTDFGLFVEVQPGIEGLLHVTQLRSGAVFESEEYEIGKSIEGWIRSLDPHHKRLQITQRPLPDSDPWQSVAERLQEGQIIQGRIDGMSRFGMLVEVEPGLVGLVPFSTLKKMGFKKPTRSFPIGSQHHLKVVSLDPSRRRLALAPEASASRKAKKAADKQQPRPKKARKTKGLEKKETPSRSGVTEFGELLAKALKGKEDSQ